MTVSKRSAIAALLVAIFDPKGGIVRKLPLPVTAIISMVVTFATATVAQTVPNVPIAVFCYAQQDKEWRVAYLSKVNENGDAVYVSANGRIGATINANGVVLPLTNQRAGTDCYGKTLDELRSNGRVMEFQRAK